MKLWKSAVVAVVLVAGAGPATASAATIKVNIGPELTESIASLVTVDWNATGTNYRSVYVYVKPTGGSGCPPSSQNARAEGDSRIFSTYEAAQQNGNHDSDTYTPTTAGDYIACGYLESSGQNLPEATTAQPFHVRVAQAPLSISQASLPFGSDVPLMATYRAEAARDLFVRYRPAGAPCASTLLLERQSSSTAVDGLDISGSGTNMFTVSAPSNAGTYIVCGYIQNDSSDTTPDVTATSTFTVAVPPPSPCDIARANVAAEQPLATATNAARTKALAAKRSAQSKSERAGRSYRRARALHAGRAKVRRLRARYASRRSAYRRAVKTFNSASTRAKKANGAVAAAQSTVDRDC